jgi:hypothetical protein
MEDYLTSSVAEKRANLTEKCLPVNSSNILYCSMPQ